MPPSELRNKTQSELWKILQHMTSPAWDVALIGASPEELERAAKQMLAVHRARFRLRNEQLASIAADLQANEADLVAGIESVDGALESLEEVETVLDAVGDFLGIVGRVIDIVI